MTTPPVHHPRERNFERRVGWGLVLLSVATLLSVVAAPPVPIRDPSLFCALTRCPQGAQWAVHLVLIGGILGVTGWWWSGRARERAVEAAEAVALYALVAWVAVVPLPGGLALPVYGGFLAGGFLVVAGTSGLLGGTDHDRTALTTWVARAGGELVWSGCVAVALLGYWPLVVPVFLLPLLAGFWMLCAEPMTWLRAHVVYALGAFLAGFPPWVVVDPGGIPPSLVLTVTRVERTDTIPLPDGRAPPDGSPVYFADEAMLLFAGVGVLAILGAALGEIALQRSPSLAERLPDAVVE